jgi:zinc resistance-associated protein
MEANMSDRHIRILALTVAAAVLCGGLMAGEAQARHRDRRPCYETLTPQLQAKYDEIMGDFQERMLPVTETLLAKRLELKALSGNANADPQRISSLAGEIAALHTQIRQERMKLGDRLQNEVGLTEGSTRNGPGMGHMYPARPDGPGCAGSKWDDDGDRMHGRMGKHRAFDAWDGPYGKGGRGYAPRHF